MRNVAAWLPITTSLFISTCSSGIRHWPGPQIAGGADPLGIHCTQPRRTCSLVANLKANQPPTACFLHHISRKHPQHQPSISLPTTCISTEHSLESYPLLVLIYIIALLSSPSLCSQNCSAAGQYLSLSFKHHPISASLTSTTYSPFSRCQVSSMVAIISSITAQIRTRWANNTMAMVDHGERLDSPLLKTPIANTGTSSLSRICQPPSRQA